VLQLCGTSRGNDTEVRRSSLPVKMSLFRFGSPPESSCVPHSCILSTFQRKNRVILIIWVCVQLFLHILNSVFNVFVDDWWWWWSSCEELSTRDESGIIFSSCSRMQPELWSGHSWVYVSLQDQRIKATAA